jgi:hypothetical protein
MTDMVDLPNEVAREQDIHRRWAAHRVLLGNGRKSVANERVLEACARDAVERDVESQEVIFQGNFCDCCKMAFRISGTDPEIGLGLERQHARVQALARVKQHIFFESLHIDLDVIGCWDCALGEQAGGGSEPSGAARSSLPQSGRSTADTSSPPSDWPD